MRTSRIENISRLQDAPTDKKTMRSGIQKKKILHIHVHRNVSSSFHRHTIIYTLSPNDRLKIESVTDRLILLEPNSRVHDDSIQERVTRKKKLQRKGFRNKILK